MGYLKRFAGTSAVIGRHRCFGQPGDALLWRRSPFVAGEVVYFHRNGLHIALRSGDA